MEGLETVTFGNYEAKELLKAVRRYCDAELAYFNSGVPDTEKYKEYRFSAINAANALRFFLAARGLG